MRRCLAAFFVTLLLAVGCIGMAQAYTASGAAMEVNPSPLFFLREQDGVYHLTLAGQTLSFTPPSFRKETVWLPAWLSLPLAVTDRVADWVAELVTEHRSPQT